MSIPKERLCPTCNKPLVQIKVPHRKMVFECTEHGKFRVVVRRHKDMNDSRNWKATCSECGGIMDYFNLRYGCRKCGNILEV